jgi:2-C-methyl-D-erythritol 4-phosphate cytidylyltransferase
MPRTVAIIPAAGGGVRLGKRKKPYIRIGEIPMIAMTLKSFERCPLIDAVAVAVAKGDVKRCHGILRKYNFKKIASIVEGGNSRQDSVWAAIRSLKNEWDIAVVHDCARPLVTPALIEKAVRKAISRGSAVTAVEPKDTVKAVSGGTVEKTLPRHSLVLVQTPQAFRFSTLKKAYQKAIKDRCTATDDSALVERLGKKVNIVKGSYENIKVTTEEDLAIVRHLIRAG